MKKFEKLGLEKFAGVEMEEGVLNFVHGGAQWTTLNGVEKGDSIEEFDGEKFLTISATNETLCTSNGGKTFGSCS